MSEAIMTLEKFLFSQDKSEFIGKMISGTDDYYYFSLLAAMNKYGVDLPKVHLENLEKYKKMSTNRAKNIFLRFSFMQLVNPKKLETEKKVILEEINKNTLYYNFDFDEPKTLRTTTINVPNSENESELNPKLLDWKGKLEESYNDIKTFRTLEDAAMTHFDLEKLSKKKNLDVISAFLARKEAREFEDIEKLLKVYISLSKAQDKSFQLKTNFYQEMSLEQMKKLAELMPEFHNQFEYVKALFIKEFEVNMEEDEILGTLEEKEQYKARLLKMYEWANTRPNKFESFSVQFLYEILQVGLEINQFDFDLFIEYLKKPKRIYGEVNLEHRAQLQQRKGQIEFNLKSQIANPVSDDKMIDLYLEAYFKQKGKIEPFDKFLKADYLKLLFHKVRLYEGEQIANITELIDPLVLTSIQNEKMINICRFNKEFFSEGEEVKLYVEIKNIPNLSIKIFEISAENYYLKKKEEITGEINIDGLIANEETFIEFKEPPQRKVIKEFKFDDISKKKQGVYIVEFLGFGYSSRALIRKGKLLLIEKVSLTGQTFQILDVKLDVCQKSKRTGLWVKSIFHEADEEGKVNLPFSAVEEKIQAIIVHNEFACLTNISLVKEEYDFRCSFLYKDESLIMGNKMKILIQPKLFLKEQPVNLDVINSQAIVVEIRTENDIPSTVVYDKIKFDYKEDVELEIPISGVVKEIKIEVKGKIKMMISKADLDIVQSHTIQVNNSTNTNRFCHLYLQYTQKGYEVLLLGKNGEPKPNIILNLGFKNKYLSSPINLQLKSDLKGRVSLGDLKDITKINVSIREKGDIEAQAQDWNIDDSQKVDYPSEMNMCEGDKTQIPYLGKELNRHKLSFFRVLGRQNILLKDMLSSLKIEKNMLDLTGLKRGTYILVLKDQGVRIRLEVHKAKYWKGTNLMIMKDYLLYVNNSIPRLFIENVERKSADKDNNFVISLFSDDIKSTRVHIFGYQFMNNDVKIYCNNLKRNMEQAKTKIIPNVQNRNHYLSNRTLNDEYCYVLNRKQESKHIGNSLEKPPILLKRAFLKETNLKLEKLEQGTNFKENIALDGKQKARERFLKDAEGKNMLSMPISSTSNKPINSFINFLKYPCLVLSNLKPDCNGRIELNSQIFEKYSTIEIVATNINSVTHEIVPIEKNELPRKDLRQNTTTKAKKFYSTLRNTSSFIKGGKFFVEDIASTEFRIVDSLSKAFDLQKDLKKYNIIFDDPEVHNYEEWNFLTKWPLLTIEEKQKCYDDFSSHELNIFLYFKDRAFFNNFIQNFLNNKIEKSFIDYFLLNDVENLKKFESLDNFHAMNTMEQILLLIHFLRSKNPQEAKNISLYLENENKSHSFDPAIWKQLFDIVLGSAPQTIPELEVPLTLERVASLQMIDSGRMNATRGRGTTRGKFGTKCPMPRMLKKKLARSDSDDEELKSHSSGSKSGSLNESMSIPRSDRSRSRSISLSNSDSGRDKMKKKRNAKEKKKEVFENDYEEDIRKRDQYQEVYTKTETTKEYSERKYFENYHLPERLVTNNLFWAELANHLITKGLETPFLSPKFIYANKTHVAMIAALAFLSLPFQSPEHTYESNEGKNLEIGMLSNSIVFHKEVKESEANIASELLITQRFYDPKDKFCFAEDNNTVKGLKTVDEFIIDKVYECEIVVTNVSISQQEFQLLYEIPHGSIPTKSNEYLKSSTMSLPSYQSQIISFSFYFPQSGKFTVYPANLSQNGIVIAVANATTFEVNNERVSKTLDTIDQILAHGSKDDILNFVATKNILNNNIFKFSDIYYLLKDKDFFLKFIEILRQRKFYDHLVWAFSIYHADLRSLKEFFNVPGVIDFGRSGIHYFSNDLVTLKNIKLLEYYPLINSRTHTFSKDKSNILNQEFKKQYKEFLDYIVEVPEPSIQDNITFVYYLLLQERVDEALKIFGKINPDDIQKKNQNCRLQYDYFCAYLDFYTGEPEFKVARSICDKYLDYPILSWRGLFYEIANQLAEYDGEELVDETNENIEKKLTEKQKNVIAAKQQEILKAELKKNELVISFQNCKELIINYYLIDLELLFSRNPFLLQGTDEFGFVLPNFSERTDVVYSNELQTKSIHIPEKLRKNNLSIQIKGSEKMATLTYFSSLLVAHVIENCAQIKVTNLEKKSLSKVYVKVFAKMKNGKVSYYKDGYTDLRGRFDYAALNIDRISEIENFALFVMSEELGSVIIEARPPSDLGKMVMKGLKSNVLEAKAQQKHKEHIEKYLAESKENKL